MSSLWPACIVASTGCYALKLVGLSLPDSLLGHPWVQRTAALLPVAMLSALIAVEVFDAGGRYGVDWHAFAGVAAAAIALMRGRGFLVVFLVAIGVSALSRLLT